MKAPQIGDVLAIPFFLWLIFYFWNKRTERDLTHQEMILFGFAITGFFADVYFVFVYKEL
jgi:TRAP-type uncharacterized transport system fused permease subunit